MPYILHSPQYKRRNLRDFNKHYIIPTYSENVEVVNGVATCRTVTAMRSLLAEGFTLAPPKKKRYGNVKEVSREERLKLRRRIRRKREKRRSK